MAGSWVLVGLSLFALADGGASVADVVTLSDGSAVRGQVVRATPWGGLVVLVRRDWASANVPRWAARWEREEAPRVLRARKDLKDRLIGWRRDRAGTAGAGDPVLAWIDREVARLSSVRPPRTSLTAVTLARSEVRAVARQPEEVGRLLRLGWLAGLGGVETMSADELTEALAFRGRLRPDDPAWVDALLPPEPEPESRWRTRRAATEAVVEPGLRFVRFRDFVLPEVEPGGDPAPRSTTELIDSPAARTAFGAIQGVTPFDPVRQRLDEAAARGRVGVVMSTVSLSVDSVEAEAEATLWVRQEKGRWEPAFTQTGTARTDEPGGGGNVAADGTPLKTALMVVESVASRPATPEESRRRQQAGEAGERALARAAAALARDLAPFLLPPAQRSGAPR